MAKFDETGRTFLFHSVGNQNIQLDGETQGADTTLLVTTGDGDSNFFVHATFRFDETGELVFEVKQDSDPCPV